MSLVHCLFRLCEICSVLSKARKNQAVPSVTVASLKVIRFPVFSYQISPIKKDTVKLQSSICCMEVRYHCSL